MNKTKLYKNKTIPVLKKFNLYSKTAEKLMLMTMVHESLNFRHRRQILNDGSFGKGMGLGQVEMNTHNDVFENYLIYKEDLLDSILNYFFPQINQLDKQDFFDYELYKDFQDNLIYNDEYNLVIARLCYYRQTERLPNINDNLGLANYWKKYYNTYGKGKVEDFLEKWELYGNNDDY